MDWIQKPPMFVKRGLVTWWCARGNHVSCGQNGGLCKVGDGEVIEHIPCRCVCHRGPKRSENPVEPKS